VGIGHRPEKPLKPLAIVATSAAGPGSLSREKHRVELG
jgi:hypothetical protein